MQVTATLTYTGGATITRFCRARTRKKSLQVEVGGEEEVGFRSAHERESSLVRVED
jgi:hypothetical protein